MKKIRLIPWTPEPRRPFPGKLFSQRRAHERMIASEQTVRLPASHEGLVRAYKRMQAELETQKMPAWLQREMERLEEERKPQKQ